MNINDWEIFKENKIKKIENNFSFFIEKLNKIRGNVISVELIRDIKTSDNRSIKTLASLRVISAREFVLKPFNAKDLSLIIKAVSNSQLGYNLERYTAEEAFFSLSLLTGEIRNNIIKDINNVANDSKKTLRMIHQDLKTFLKNNKQFSQDQKKAQEKHLEKQIKIYQDKITEAEEKKIKSINN